MGGYLGVYLRIGWFFGLEFLVNLGDFVFQCCVIVGWGYQVCQVDGLVDQLQVYYIGSYCYGWVFVFDVGYGWL